MEEGKPKHTPEPICVGASFDSRNYPVFRLREMSSDSDEVISATAQRIEKCYNDCAGIKDPASMISEIRRDMPGWIEKAREVEEQRDALLGAANHVLSILEAGKTPGEVSKALLRKAITGDR